MSMNNKLKSLLLIVFFLSVKLPAFAENIMVPDSLLRVLVEEMIAANPSLASYRYDADLQKSLITVESAWSDPKLTMGVANLPVDTWKLNQEAMTGIWLTASQSIPLTSRNTYLGENARILAEVKSDLLEAETLQLIQNLTDAWYDLKFNQEAIERVERTIQNYEELIIIVQTQYQSGQKNQSALFRLQTAKSKLRERKLDYIRNIESAKTKISLLLGRTFAGADLVRQDLDSSFSELNQDTLTEKMLLSNPYLAISREKLQSAAVGKKIARASWWPDVSISAGYGYRQDSENGTERPDFFSLTAGFSLPVFGAKKQAKVVEASILRVNLAVADLKQTELHLKYILQNGIDEDKKLEDQLKIYNEEIIPQSQDALAAFIREFTSGFADVNAVIMAQNDVLDAEQIRLSKISERRKLRVHITSIAGLNEYLSESKHSDRRSDRDE